MDVLEGLFGVQYRLLQIHVEPADAGHAGVVGPRTYIVIVNRQKTVYLHDFYELYERVRHKIRSRVHTRVRDYMVASDRARASFNLGLCQRRQVEPDEESACACSG